VVGSLLTSSPRLNKEVVLHGVVRRLTGRHWPAKKKSNPGTVDQSPSKDCRVCYAKGLRTPKGKPLKTVWICKTYPTEPGLHIEEG
jgi:hypothetical protein